MKLKTQFFSKQNTCIDPVERLPKIKSSSSDLRAHKMWRPWWNAMQRVALSSRKEVPFWSWRARNSAPAPSAARLTLVSASVGVLVGTGYSFYTHYKVNKTSQSHIPDIPIEYTFLPEAPTIKPHYKVVSHTDEDPQLVLFQYQTCPFCCKVRAYLDYHSIPYLLVEVDAVLRQAIRWSTYKKVPILLAKVENGYQQLLDSTAIISILETQRLDTDSRLQDLVKYYPMKSYTDDKGKSTTEIVNRYFIMHNSNIPDQDKKAEQEERQWRQWADSVLVHVLSPNVYRTLDEAFHSFNWFAEVGHWRENFPAWEVGIMVNVGAVAMWLISKRLKTRHNLKDDVRQSLYSAANEWTTALEKKGGQFHGGSQPNLADLAVYGVLCSIEGSHAFQDLRKHTRITSWYDATKAYIQARRGQAIAL